MPTKITVQQVKRMATLANIPISFDEEKKLASAFDETLAVIDELKTINVDKIEPTHQVTGLENILRNDEINTEAMFSQKEALANADKTHQGYFVIPRIANQED